MAALEEVQLSKISEITRRAFLQFLHPNHTQSPVAAICSALFRASVARLFGKLPLSKK
jgi:hypothetical protein